MTEERTAHDGDQPSTIQHSEWDPYAYQRVSHPSIGWSHEVLTRLHLRGDETVIDAGCGPGDLTAELLARLPRGHVIAIDLSTNMLRLASSRLSASYGEHVSFRLADLEALDVHDVADAIFSRATFHWIRDHPRLFRHLYPALKPGGLLVAQSGGAGNVARILTRAHALMASPPFEPYFRQWSDPFEWADPGTTKKRLEDAGFRRVSARIESDRIVMPDAEHYGVFLQAVALRVHVDQIEDTELRTQFLEELIRQGARDDPPFVLDLRLLDIDAERPG